MKRTIHALSAAAAVVAAARIVDHLLAPSFEHRVVLITGGSRGLGLALARRFAREGARLALVAGNVEVLEHARRELLDLGAEVHIIAADLTHKDEALRTVEEVVRRFGGLDVLVNNAGVIQVGPMEAMTLEDAIDNPPAGQDTTLQDRSLRKG
jgi:NAD(P)-dependent dehydrogenase (short-subunit alcohol dehydrogenase family)